MHLHRILFVILENLLKGNPFTLATFWAKQLLLLMPWVTATSGNWLRVAAKPHCVACHQQTSFQKWKGLSKAASHLSGAGLTLEAASQGKKTTQNHLHLLWWGDLHPSSEGKITLPGRKLLSKQMFFLAVCRHRSLEIILLLTSNSLSQRKENKQSVNLEAYGSFRAGKLLTVK